MKPFPRYVEIDYSKYHKDIPPEQRETFFGLPQKVQYCK